LTCSRLFNENLRNGSTTSFIVFSKDKSCKNFTRISLNLLSGYKTPKHDKEVELANKKGYTKPIPENKEAFHQINYQWFIAFGSEKIWRVDYTTKNQCTEEVFMMKGPSPYKKNLELGIMYSVTPDD
jgi:hypothetical protein